MHLGSKVMCGALKQHAQGSQWIIITNPRVLYRDRLRRRYIPRSNRKSLILTRQLGQERGIMLSVCNQKMGFF